MPEFATSPSFESELAVSFNVIARKDDKEIRQKLRKSISLSSIFKSTTGVRGKVRFTEMLVNSVTQPYQAGWQRKGGIKFTPNEYDLFYGKINDDFDPLALRDSYLGDILEIDNSTKVANKLAQLYFGAVVTKTGKENDDALINGVYKKPINGVPGHYLEVCNGLKHVIASEVAEGKIAKVGDNTVITSANAGSIMYRMWCELPEDMRFSPSLRCYTFSNTYQLFKEWFEEERGLMNNFNGVKNIIPNTDCPIVVLPNGRGSNMILFTVEDNIRLFDCNPADIKQTHAEYSKDEMHVSMHYGTGIGFVISGKASVDDEQYVWVNSNCDFIQAAEPDFTIEDPAAITATGATITGTASGDSMVFSETGIQYKQKVATDWTDTKVAITGASTVTKTLVLLPNIEYQVRIYGITPAGRFTSGTKEFKTLAE